MEAAASAQLSSLIKPVVRLARDAGRIIMPLFRSRELGVDYKADRTPVTDADHAAHEHIVSGLMRLTPNIPVLSEESGPEMRTRQRLDWPLHWLVDPLDGTREFIRGGEEFTVNIALIDAELPVLGVVYAPAKGEMYFGSKGAGAFMDGEGPDAATKICVVRPPPKPLRVLASRSYAASAVELYVGAMGKTHRRAVASSLKFCLVARGQADVYPRLGPTSEWDTAAGQAVLESAGGAVLGLDGQPFRYRKQSILNPPFIACGDPDHDWLRYLP
ncbi:3'(2'),5'-bisphosphate nucleotidase CysQ [Candidatus Foliamicus sp.]